jgi:hypothetical protein
MPDIDLNRPYLTAAAASKQYDLSNNHLTRLLRIGILEGFRLGREWFVYTDSLEKYLASPRKPGPKGPIKKKISYSPTEKSTSNLDKRTRRRHGEGTVTLRKDGRWQADISLGIDETTGKRKRLTRYGRTEEEAYAKLHEALQELGRGTLIKKKPL